MTGIEKWTLDEEFQQAGGRRWVALIDGSDHSRFAAVRPRDPVKYRSRVTVVYLVPCCVLDEVGP